VGVLGWGRQIAAFCMEMLTWTPHLTLLTHGHDPELPPKASAALRRHRIEVIPTPIARIVGLDGPQALELTDGSTLPIDALFFHIAYGPGCSIPADLG